MSHRLERFLGRTPGQRRARYVAVLAAVVVVPLAVAGLVSGALGGASGTLDKIPAIVVNNDEMVTTTLPDGTEQQVLAGRQLVTELTRSGDEASAGFEWSLSNDAEAAKALADGETYAVLTIPADFSDSVLSISGADPTRADLGIRTDDAHGYLAGSVVQSVGDAMTAAFGRELTAQYLEGFYGSLAALGGSLGEAADGAAQLSSGLDGLAGGLDQLASGVAQAAGGATDAASGAQVYADGVGQYTSGVDGLAGGIAALNAQANAPEGGLDALASGVADYTSGVSAALSGMQAQLGPVADGFAAYLAAHPEVAADPAVQAAAASLGGVGAGLDPLLAAGDALTSGTRDAVDGLTGGIAQLADGAAQLSAGSTGIRDGASGLASGVDELATGLGSLSTGAGEAASGARALEGGATQLASGLAEGAAQAAAVTDIDASRTADIVSQPVAVETTRENPIGSIGEVIGMLFVPVGLWIGALALFLVSRPLGRLALRSTASTGRIVARTLVRAGLVALAQAVVVVLLLHLALGVSWTLLPQTLSFAVLLALAFTAIHAFLSIALGRFGLVISLLLVTLQLTAAGGVFPLEIVSGPFQAISPFLPLTWGVQGMQAIVAGVGGSAAGAAAGALVLFALLAIVGTLIVVARKRGIRSLAPVVPTT